MSRIFAYILVLWVGLWTLVGLLIAPIWIGIQIGLGLGTSKIHKSLEDL